MIESPWLKEVLEESNAELARRYILEFLTGRFGVVGPDVTTALQRISDLARLEELNRVASRCADLDAFRARL